MEPFTTIDFFSKICYHIKFVKLRTSQGEVLNTDFFTRASTKAWFVEEFKQFPALPSFTATRDELTNWVLGRADIPSVYEAMVGYRQHLQLAYQDAMATEELYEAFIRAAQEAGKLTITEG